MRDGVKIAVDLYLPRSRINGQKFPTILRQTRYFRSWDVRWPFNKRRIYSLKRRFLANGYAWLDVDVRGTGASFGSRNGPWSPDEVKDGGEIIDWIIRQPWSNGNVGATGRSYAGTAAEMLMINQHPALKAVVPQFSLFDTGFDIVFPGGIHLEWFTKTWTKFNDALDRNEVGEVNKGWRFKLFAKGVRPVDDNENGEILRQAVASHIYNYNPHELAKKITFRDDPWPTDPGLPIETFSPHGHIQSFRSSGVPIYSYSGWCDGAYAYSAIKRFINVRTPGSRMVIGPWMHGGFYNCSPYSQGKSQFDHPGELLRFFDHFLKGVNNGIQSEKRVHYYTMGEEHWKSADTWPPKGLKTNFLFLSSNQSLSGTTPEFENQWDEYQVDYSAGTGDRSRWNTLITNGPVSYPDRAEKDQKLLVYNSPRLEKDLEVTGHPIVTLFVRSTASDGNFFVYLEDVDEKGQVRYVTEGMLRALHRKISHNGPQPYLDLVPFHSAKRKDAMPFLDGEIAELRFGLLPTSYLYKKGHSIRVAIAGADKDHFLVPSVPPPTWRVYRDQTYPSRIELPVMPRGNRAEISDH